MTADISLPEHTVLRCFNDIVKMLETFAVPGISRKFHQFLIERKFCTEEDIGRDWEGSNITYRFQTGPLLRNGKNARELVLEIEIPKIDGTSLKHTFVMLYRSTNPSCKITEVFLDSDTSVGGGFQMIRGDRKVD